MYFEFLQSLASKRPSDFKSRSLPIPDSNGYKFVVYDIADLRLEFGINNPNRGVQPFCASPIGFVDLLTRHLANDNSGTRDQWIAVPRSIRIANTLEGFACS